MSEIVCEYDFQKGTPMESDELYLAALDNDEARVLSAGHDYLAKKYMQLACSYQRFLEAILGQRIGLDIDAFLDENDRLRAEVAELKKKRPGGRKNVYTTAEREQVARLRRDGWSYARICTETGMSKNTVTRILQEAGMTQSRQQVDNCEDKRIQESDFANTEE